MTTVTTQQVIRVIRLSMTGSGRHVVGGELMWVGTDIDELARAFPRLEGADPLAEVTFEDGFLVEHVEFVADYVLHDDVGVFLFSANADLGDGELIIDPRTEIRLEDYETEHDFSPLCDDCGSHRDHIHCQWCDFSMSRQVAESLCEGCRKAFKE